MEAAEAFLAYLAGEGLSDEHLAAYRALLTELAAHPSLSAAIRAAEDAGKSPREIANLRKVAGRFAEFKEQGAVGTPQTKTAPATRPSEPALETEPKRPLAPALDVEPKRPAAASTTGARHDHASSAPRRGCSCRTRYDVYLDNDFGALAKMLGGGVGIGTFILIRLVGALGALALATGLAGLGGIVTVMMIGFRCEGCRQRVTDLDQDERAHLRKGRAMAVLVTAGLLAAAAVCGYLWWLAVKARDQM